MTTNLLKLTAAVTSDSDDTLLRGEIRRHADDIRRTLQRGEDYQLKSSAGTVTIRADKNRSEKNPSVKRA